MLLHEIQTPAGEKSITGTARASSSLHQLAVWPPRTATRGNRWGDTHVGSAGGPEGASEAGVSGRFLPFLAVLWPLRARNGQKRPETACRRSVAARPPRPCLGAVGYQLTLHGSLEKRRNESKLSILQLPFFHVLAWRRGAPSQLLAPHGQVASLHQLAVWPPRTATRGNRWGDTHVGSAGGPEGASEAGVSGRFLPFLAVLWPLRARNGQKRPETACRRSVAARPPRPCLGAVGYQLTLLGSLEKRRNESKLLDQQPRELLQVKADVK